MEKTIKILEKRTANKDDAINIVFTVIFKYSPPTFLFHFHIILLYGNESINLNVVNDEILS